MKIVFGNEYKYLEGSFDKNVHSWKVYVKLEDIPSGVKESDLIEKVKFKLHPTFNPPEVVKDKPPYLVSRLGWGTFNIEIEVDWKKPIP